MKELFKKIAYPEATAFKSVDLYINSEIICITGNWKWDLSSDTIFCSDVMIGLGQHYPGTKSIIHPDDINTVKQKIVEIKNEPADIEFKIITTYGEVKTLSGKNCFITETNELRITDPKKEIRDAAAKQKEYEKGNENFYQLRQITDHAETITKTGTWYINTSSLEVFYSDNVYRIHGIKPQSLNAHLHTFSIFIHPDDATAVTDAFNEAYEEKLPLHIEYRIIVGDETEKFITLITHWTHNLKGEDVLSGLITDRSESVFAFNKAEEAENHLEFYSRILKMTEKTGNTAFWYMNLLTKQTYFSDNYYRIHGLKPKSVPASPALFLNYVHPEDMEKVADSIASTQRQHETNDIEYRIIRADRKVRILRQKAELITYAGNELIMAYTIQDVTAQIQNEKKLHELLNTASIKDFIQTQSEEMGNIGSWMWQPETNYRIWSDAIYDLLGYKKSVKELSEVQLLRVVLPEDRAQFNDQKQAVIEGLGDRKFNFRILKIGDVRNMQACFKLMTFDDKKIFVGTLQDVTETIQTKEKLFENLRLNQMLTENILDRIFITDANNNIVLWNKKTEEYVRVKKEDVIGKNYFDVFPESKTEKIINRFNGVLKGDELHFSGERSGQKKYYDLHMIPLKDSNNKVMGILHVMHDVSREIQLHNSLNERISFIERLLEETVDRIIVLDKNFNYTYWNKKAEQHYHINKEYVIGKNLLEIFPSFVNDHVYQKLQQALKGKTVHISPDEQTRDENKFSESYFIPLLNEIDEVTGVLCIVHDLSNKVAPKT